MTDFNFEWYNQHVDLVKVVSHYGWQMVKKGSTKNSVKFTDGQDTIVIKKQNNTFWHVTNSKKGGGPIEFVMQVKFPNIGKGSWSKEVFDEFAMLAGSSNDYVVEQAIKSDGFSKRDRYRINTFLTKYTEPAGAHDYLVNDRMIDPELLKNQAKFGQCIRVPSDKSKKFLNAMFVHRDNDGPCAYEKHNTSYSGNVNFLSPNSKKAVWYTDDFYSKSAQTVFIGEAAIDALSVASLVKNDMVLFSPGGSFDQSIYDKDQDGNILLDDDGKRVVTKTNDTLNLFKSMFGRSHAKQIILGHDNDSAGNKYDEFFTNFFNEFFPDKFKVKIEKAPMALNDWNNYLAVERFHNKSKYLDLAKNTQELIIAEGGVNKFRMIPSKVKLGAVIMVVPPAGFQSSNLNSLAMSFLYVMRKHNENSVVSYSPNIQGTYSHTKYMEKWRSEFLESLEYKKITTNPISYLKAQNKLVDLSVANDWEGYTKTNKHPHKLASSTSEIILTQSNDEKTHYYHSSYPPLSMIVAVPSVDVQQQNPDCLFESSKFIELVAKNEHTNKIIRFSPVKHSDGKMKISHCAFIKSNIVQDETTYQDVKYYTDKPVKGFANVLDVLGSKDLLVAPDIKKKQPNNIAKISDARKAISRSQEPTSMNPLRSV